MHVQGTASNIRVGSRPARAPHGHRRRRPSAVAGAGRVVRELVGGLVGVGVAVVAIALLMTVVRQGAPLPAAARPDDVLLLLLGWVGVLLAAWLALGSLLAVAALLPGAAGRAAASVGGRITPLAVRKVLALALGASVGSLALPPAPVSVAGSGPVARSTDPGVVAGGGVTPSDLAPGFAPTEPTPGFAPTLDGGRRAATVPPLPRVPPTPTGPGYVPTAPPPVHDADRPRLLAPAPRPTSRPTTSFPSAVATPCGPSRLATWGRAPPTPRSPGSGPDGMPRTGPSSGTTPTCSRRDGCCDHRPRRSRRPLRSAPPPASARVPAPPRAPPPGKEPRDDASRRGNSRPVGHLHACRLHRAAHPPDRTTGHQRRRGVARGTAVRAGRPRPRLPRRPRRRGLRASAHPLEPAARPGAAGGSPRPGHHRGGLGAATGAAAHPAHGPTIYSVIARQAMVAGRRRTPGHEGPRSCAVCGCANPPTGSSRPARSSSRTAASEPWPSGSKASTAAGSSRPSRSAERGAEHRAPPVMAPHPAYVPCRSHERPRHRVGARAVCPTSCGKRVVSGACA